LHVLTLAKQAFFHSHGQTASFVIPLTAKCLLSPLRLFHSPERFHGFLLSNNYCLVASSPIRLDSLGLPALSSPFPPHSVPKGLLFDYFFSFELPTVNDRWFFCLFSPVACAFMPLSSPQYYLGLALDKSPAIIVTPILDHPSFLDLFWFELLLCPYYAASSLGTAPSLRATPSFRPLFLPFLLSQDLRSSFYPSWPDQIHLIAISQPVWPNPPVCSRESRNFPLPFLSFFPKPLCGVLLPWQIGAFFRFPVAMAPGGGGLGVGLWGLDLRKALPFSPLHFLALDCLAGNLYPVPSVHFSPLLTFYTFFNPIFPFLFFITLLVFCVRAQSPSFNLEPTNFSSYSSFKPPPQIPPPCLAPSLALIPYVSTRLLAGTLPCRPPPFIPEPCPCDVVYMG